MRPLLRILALIGLFPYAGVVLLLLTGTASWSSVAYVVAIGVLLGGLVTLPDAPRTGIDEVDDKRRKRRPRGLSRGAVLAIAAIAIGRMLVARDGRTMRVGDGANGEESARLVNRLVDEPPHAPGSSEVVTPPRSAVVFLHGFDAPAAGVPTLVIHGRHDTMTSYDESPRYAQRNGATLVSLDAGHFAMLVRGEETDRALRGFVAGRVERRAER
jgi:pimeloyl-ACP methyl ester carboxylesterase